MPDNAPHQPVVALQRDREALVGVLTRAFETDPVAQWLICQDERRNERSDHLFRWFLNESLPHGITYTTVQHQGAALWIPPNKWKMPLYRQIFHLSEIIRVAGVRNLVSRIRGVDAYQKVHPNTPHYYLLVLGVEPSEQGRGVGTALMQPVLQRCDRDGVPAYLETGKEENLPLYERNGFVVTGEVYGGKHGPKQWLMWRDPR